MSTSITDPVCGMPVPPETGFSATYGDRQFRFCSDFCLRRFLDDPGRYAGASGVPAPERAEVLRRIAYFSMEVGADPRMPTYSGGLGVLAGDTLRSAADLKVPLVAVSLLYRKGYFDQVLDEKGNQQERAVGWDPAEFARLLPITIEVTIEGRPVVVKAWQYDVTGSTGFTVPLYLLDTGAEENEPIDRELSDWLYGGDQRYRLAQEIVLGIGGVRMLRALGYTQLERFHLNEGHASLLVLELLREGQTQNPTGWQFGDIRSRCVFTTHTPVPYGHDRFAYDLVHRVLGEPLPPEMVRMLGGADLLNTSHYVNGVAKRHREVSQRMFPEYAIDSITNGVHSPTWVSEGFRALYNHYLPGWSADPAVFRYAMRIPREEIWQAHAQAKARLIDEVRQQTGQVLDSEALTIGFARRATQYKRADLVLSDPDRLTEIAQASGPLQLVFAGKAHPQDFGGKEVIRRLFEAARHLEGQVKVVYLANYDMALAGLLTAGVDLWLNTPQPPLEASGTSGMKAAHNGVPSFSVLDGWWVEGHIEGVTGWSISAGQAAEGHAENECAQELYQKLRTTIAPLFYGEHNSWVDVMRQSIALNASFFNTHRMVQQYVVNAYI